MYPDYLKYSKDHEWVKNDGTVGVTEYAQKELGDVVFVELPNVGKEIQKGHDLGVLESVKAVSNVFSPVSGKVKQINDLLVSEPELINKAPYTDGWIAEIEIKDKKELDSLMNAAEYEKYVNEIHSKH